jgi:hypothetical protein
MKFKIIISCLMMCGITDAAVVHKASSFLETGSHAAAIDSNASRRMSSLGKTVHEYSNYLTTGEGDFNLWGLITPKTEISGNRSLGFTAQDINRIKRFVEEDRLGTHQPVIKLAQPVLPEWLAEQYKNITFDLIDRVVAGRGYEYLGTPDVRTAVAEYFLQKYMKDNNKIPRYFYQRKDSNAKYRNEPFEEELKEALGLVKEKTLYISPSTLSQALPAAGPALKYVIVDALMVYDPAVVSLINNLVAANSELVVIIAFYNYLFQIPNSFELKLTTVRHLVIAGQNLTRIGDNFFRDSFRDRNINLTSIILPAGLTQVGDQFLYGCTGLTSIVFPVGLVQVGNDFLMHCTGLTSIVLPAGLAQAGARFLFLCTGLTSIVLPAGLAQVETHFLADCIGLISIVLPAGLMQVGTHFLFGCTGLKSIMLPEGLTHAGNGFLARCTGLTSIILPKGLTQAGNNFLYDCTALTSIILSEGLTQVGSSFLEGCRALTSIILPAGLRQVGGRFLESCTGLTSLIIPRGLTQVGPHFLKDTDNLKELYIHQDTYEKIKQFIPEHIKISFFKEDQSASDAAAEEDQRASGAAATAAKA